MKKRYIIFSLFSLILFSGHTQVVINEFSASNHDAFADIFGDYQEWIELYNTSGSAFNLTGYHLSDRDNNPTKWQFPAGTTIPANGFLRVWASGRDVSSGGQIHTNFKLTQRQPVPEYVVFADPLGNILESYHLLQYATQRNHSWGRVTNGALTFGIFTSPTPGASNTGTSFTRYASDVIFGLAGGFYAAAQNVTLSTNEPNSVIRYTTNGDIPDASSPVYSGPINIPATTVLQSRVFSNNSQILPGFYDFNTYFINVSHSVPVVSIAGTNVSNLLGGNSGLRPHGCVEYFENGVLMTKVTGEFNKHGNDSWAYSQRGIDFISRDEFGYGDALRYKIFAMKTRQRFQRVMFKAAANDNYPATNGGAHIRDAYVHELSQRADLKLDERTYEPCVLYLNGQYWGVYETREKVDDPDFTEYYYDQDKPNLYFLKTWGGTWAEYGGAAATNDWQNLRTYIQTNNMGDPIHYDYVKARLNLMSLIDYFIINTHTVCSDWLNWNTGWWRGLDSAGSAKRWRYILWDNDATFGHYINYTGIPNTSPYADPCFGQDLPNPGGQGHTNIMSKLYNESDDFRQMYLDRYFQLVTGPLHCDNMILILDELIARIEPEMPQHITRWGGNMTTWQNNVQAIRDFINQRCIVVQQGIADCFSLLGPYTIIFEVDPPGAGNIEINSNLITAFPHTDSFYSQVTNALIANAYTGYTFSHWEFYNNVPNPNFISDSITVSFNATDTIIAHFTLGATTSDITLIVQPPGAGQISINAFTPPSYPWSGTFTDSITIQLVATPASGFLFSNWTSQNHTLLPNTGTQQVSFMLLENDTIIAYFAEEPEFYNLQVNVYPPNSGEVILNGAIPVTLSHHEVFNMPTTIQLQATDRNNYIFSHWTINNHILLPDHYSSNVSFLLTQDDIVTANFNIRETGIYFPGSFTPNGDGLNDEFFLQSEYDFAETEIIILSRWGDVMFTSKDPSFRWDGRYKGSISPTGVYVYFFKYRLKDSSESILLKGAVTIFQ
jgi:gliding motility-associated-like protein